MTPGAPRRTVRSYVLRAGRTTEAQARALAVLGPRFLLPFEPRPLEFAQVFGRAAPTVLEIGSGMGEATAQIAAARPACDFIACEVHEAGVGALLKRIGEAGLVNVRVVRHDAVAVLEQMIAPHSLAGAHLYFPDPWHKKRHHKRRLVQPSFVRLVAARLAPGGYLHCATDWEPYAVQMLEVLSAEPLLQNTATTYASRPAWRPATKFENRAERLGATVWELLFVTRSTR